MLVGNRLGRYEITELIGAGGMGEVYLAKDRELGRKVALKVLRPEFCNDDDRVKRFLYEAKAVSGLNHPGIITIHEIVQPEDRLFIATEFIEGETLRDKIEKKELDLYQSLSIAHQIAEALTVAHEAKIIHRDIKPENIMVRKDGIAKVLDFGLAKPMFEGASGDENGHLLVETQPGLVIGSVRYMSPEQARGRDTDDGTDIWGLGIVLYEMITGENPFEGESISDQLAALIHNEPKPLEETPPEISDIIRICLQKNRADRYENIKELAKAIHMARLNLELSLNGTGSGSFGRPAVHDTSENKTLIHRTYSSDDTFGMKSASENLTKVHKAERWGGIRMYSLAAFALLVLVSVGGWFLAPGLLGTAGPSFDSIQVSRLTNEGNAGMAAVSPDGKLVAFAEVRKPQSRLLVKQVATGSEVEIVPRTDRSFLQPAFTHDGEFIYYVSKKSGVGKLYKVSALGGESRPIAVDVDSRPAVSHDDARIAFIRHDPNRGGDSIFVADSDGKNLRRFLETKEIGFNKIEDVIWSHDGKRLIISGQKETDTDVRRTRLVSIELETKAIVSEPAVAAYETGEWSYARGFESLNGDSGMVFVGKRNLEDTMQVWHLDTASGKIKPVTTDTSDYESVSVSHDGKVLIATKAEWSSGLSSFDPVTREIKEIKPNSKSFYGRSGIAESDDGRLIYPVHEGREINLFSIDPVTGEETRLTRDAGFNMQPAVSPVDGSLVFSSNRGDANGLWKTDADGRNAVQLTSIENGRDVAPAFINGGKTVVFSRQKNDYGSARLMKVSIDGGEAEELWPPGKSSQMMLRVSPDMERIAFVQVDYDEDEAKLHTTIRVANVEGDNVALTDFGIEAEHRDWLTWSPTGDSLMTVKTDGTSSLWELPLDGRPEREAATISTGDVRSFFWSKDGRRVYLVRGVESSDLVLVRSVEGE